MKLMRKDDNSLSPWRLDLQSNYSARHQAWLALSPAD